MDPSLRAAWRRLRAEASRLLPLVAALGTGIWLAAAGAVYASSRSMALSLAARAGSPRHRAAGHWPDRVAASLWSTLSRAASSVEAAAAAAHRTAERVDAALIARLAGGW